MKQCQSLLLGCLCLGSTLDYKESLRFLEIAVNLGINEFDTGSLYGNKKSEAILGDFSYAHQLPLNIHTKIGLEESRRQDGSFGVALANLTPEKIKADAIRAQQILKQSSLGRLTLHSFCSEVPISEQIDALEELIKSGVIKNYGLANYSPHELEAWISYCNKNTKLLPSDLDLHFNLLEQRVKYEVMPLIETSDINIIPYRVFCRGVLSGRYISTGSFPSDSRANTSWRVKRVITDQNISFVSTLKAICHKYGLPLIDLVLLWTLSFDKIKKVCIGTSKTDQLSQIVDSLNRLQSHPIDMIMKEIKEIELDVFKKLPSTYFET